MSTDLTAGQSAYLSAVKDALPAGFPLDVSSGVRTPEEQASAMLTKVRKYGEDSLNIYADDALIARLLALPRDVASWAAVIRADGMNLSRHLWGGALDFRTKHLTSSQRSQLVSAIVATGGRALTEEDHLHADLPKTYTAASYLEKAATNYWWVGLIAAAAVAGAILYRRRFRT